MHAAIYRVRPDVHTIVHTHQVNVCTIASLGDSITAPFDEQDRFLGRRMHLIPYAPSGTKLLAWVVASSVKGGDNAFLMRNHGCLRFAYDLSRTAHKVQIPEKYWLAYLISLYAGRKPGRIPLAVRVLAFAKLRSDEKQFS